MANQVDSPKNLGFYSGLVAKAAPLAWGMALCALVTLIAVTMQALEETLIGHPYVEAIVAAILLGTTIRTLWEPGGRWRAGIAFTAKQLLEVAVALLGASLRRIRSCAAGCHHRRRCSVACGKLRHKPIARPAGSPFDPDRVWQLDMRQLGDCRGGACHWSQHR